LKAHHGGILSFLTAPHNSRLFGVLGADTPDYAIIFLREGCTDPVLND